MEELSCSQSRRSTRLQQTASSSRLQLWKDSLTDVPSSVNIGLEEAESLPVGSGEVWLRWRAINRLRTGMGRAKTMMRRWGYLDDSQSVDCDCGEPQTMAHPFSCRLLVVCLPGARIEHVTERVEKIVGRGNGGTILVHVGTNNTDKEGTTAIVEKYRKLLKKTKQARLGQIILSGILPVCGNRIQGYRNSKRMAVNGMVERLCKEEEVGYVDMWDSFVGNEELYFRDGLHLSGKGAAVLAEGLSGAVASGLRKVRYLN